jgi:hypothetical protein
MNTLGIIAIGIACFSLGFNFKTLLDKLLDK